MLLDRRGLMLGATAFAVAARQAHAEDPGETIALWPEGPPGGPGPSDKEAIGPNGAYTNIAVPRMVMRRPRKPTGAAMLILGGGGYHRIGITKESQPTARWLGDVGVTTFVLYYRLPIGGWPIVSPFQDAQRAMRIIRARATDFAVDPARVGILGFSAGGHLAGTTATSPGAALYPPRDASDAVSARPDLACLIYPVITMLPPFNTRMSSATLLGDAPTLAQRVALSVERQVTSLTPPTFLAHAGDDPIAPVENSLLLYTALRQARVPAALHVFRAGGHGFGLGKPDSETSAWPRLFATWAGFA